MSLHAGTSQGGGGSVTTSTVYGPSASTVGAAAIWGNTTGTVLADSRVILTQPAGTATATATFIAGKTFTVNNTLALSGTDGKSLTISNTGTLAGGDGFTLAIAAAKTFTVNNSLTLSGTDGVVLTTPTTSATIARTDAAQTFTGLQTFTSGISIASGSTLDWNSDLFVRRSAAANIVLGASDAATATAQTLSVQNVAAGNSNTSGANFIVAGSQSTGTGTGGSIVFQTAGTASTGTSQNALGTVLTLTGSKQVVVTDGLRTRPGLVFSSGTSIGIWYDSGTLRISGNSVDWFQSLQGGISLPTGSYLDWAGDTKITRKGAANAQLGDTDSASPVAQTLSVQNVVAGNANVSAVNFTINGSRSNGTGTSGDIILQTGASGTSSGTQNALNVGLTIKGGTAVGKSGSVVFGSAALTTGATDGFVYIPTCAGTPTGTPTSFTGRVAMIYDTSADQFWIYSGGAWKQPKTPAGAAVVTWQ